MASVSRLGRGRQFLGGAVVALLALFGAQTVYQKFYAHHPRFTPDGGTVGFAQRFSGRFAALQRNQLRQQLPVQAQRRRIALKQLGTPIAL